MDTKNGVRQYRQKMGRPLFDNPKSELIRVRVDHAILSKLDACTEKFGTTRSGVIRKGIENRENHTSSMCRRHKILQQSKSN